MPKFRLKTGKTVNKFLAGAGIVSLGGLALGMISPGLAGSTAGKALEAAAAFGVGGIESLAGAAVNMFAGHSLTSFSGSNALDNVQTESL